MEITLQELLDSRDARVEHQKKLAREFPRASLVCFTVILPGPVKRDDRSLAIARAGVQAILKTFDSAIIFQEERDLATGFEAYFVVNLPAVEVKRICCGIEDSHPLGRLMDIDVIADSSVSPGMTGESSIRPLGRAEIGLPERRCLLCEKPARVCMRAHIHTREEIDAKIGSLLRENGFSDKE